MFMDWLNTLAGFLVGALVGMTGVGGGSLMAPILILLFGTAPVTAVGTDLWFAAITKTVGGAVHQRQGGVEKGVDKQVLIRLLIGSLPAAIVTLLVLHFTGTAQIKKGVIVYSLGFVLILTAIATVFRHRLVEWSRKYQFKHGHGSLNIQLPLTVIAGISLGTLVTLTSVGAGALGVTMILMLYPLRMNANKLVATDIVHAIPLTLIGGIGYILLGKAIHPVPGHYMLGNIDVTLLWKLLLGSNPGIIIGSWLTKYIPERALQVVLAIVLALVGVRMLFA
jgi:uncharacterized membrane protein YfcA